MIYIRDYRNLNGIVNSQSYTFRRCLQDSLGKTITVFTSSGGTSGRGFTGLMTDISADCLRLLTKPSSSLERRNTRNCTLSTETVIRIEQIVAVSMAYI